MRKPRAVIRAEWVHQLRIEIEQRIAEYEAYPPVMRANGFARLVLADGIAKLAETNAHLLEAREPK